MEKDRLNVNLVEGKAGARAPLEGAGQVRAHANVTLKVVAKNGVDRGANDKIVVWVVVVRKAGREPDCECDKGRDAGMSEACVGRGEVGGRREGGGGSWPVK